MCASAREPRTWRSALRAKQHSACSGKDEIRSRKSAIIRGSERLDASLRCGSTSTCGVPAVDLYRLSPQGRRRFAVSVAYYCCFFLIYCLPAVLPQNLQQQQPQQKHFAGAPDFLEQSNDRHQQRLSTLFSGASPLPLFEGVAAATVPVLPAAAGGEEAARGPAAKNEVLPAPAEARFYFHGAATGRLSRGGPTGRHVESGILDVKSEKQQLAQDSRVPWQQQRKGTRNDREEETIKQKEEGRENSGPRGADTGPTTRVPQLRGEENSHQKKQPSTHALERSIVHIPGKEYLLEKVKSWREDSKHGDEKEVFEQSAEIEESVQGKHGSAASRSSVQTLATAVSSAAHHPAASPVEEFPECEAVVRNCLKLSSAARRSECRASTEGQTANCRGTGASPERVHAITPVALFGIVAPQTKDVPDAAVLNADSTSSGVLPGAAYTVRRRLAAVSAPSAKSSAGNVANPPSHSNARGPGMHPEQPPGTIKETHAGEATETLVTRDEDSEIGGLSADGTLSDVSRNRQVQRRRRGNPRGAAFESRRKGTDALPVGGVTRAIGTAELPESSPELDEEVSRHQLWKTYPGLPGSNVWRTKSIDLELRRRLGSNTGGDSVAVDGNDGRAIGDSGAVRSRHDGPRGNRFSRLLGGVDAAVGTYSTRTLDSSTTSVPSPQQAEWSVPSSANPVEPIVPAKASWSSADSLRGETVPGRERVSSATKVRRFKDQVEQLLALNGVVEAAAEAKAESASGTSNGRVPGSGPQLRKPLHSVIDVGVTPERAGHVSAGETRRLYQAGASGWQQQLKEEAQTDLLGSAAGLRKPSHLPSPIEEPQGAEGAGWPAEKAEEATEDSLEIQEVIRRRYVDKPLGKRQRVAILIEAILTLLSSWMYTRLTVGLMRTSNPSASFPFLLAKAFAVMWMGRKILTNLGFVGSAIQVLVQDIFLRRKRQQLLAIADALRTLQEEEKRMQPYT